MSWQDASDEELLQAYRQATPADKRELASQLFDRHYTRVARWCFRFTGERESAADLAQNVFVNVYRHLESFQGASRFSTWLYTITRHECLARLRRDRGRPEESDEDALVDVPTADPGPDTLAEQQSRADYAHKVLVDTLDEVERQVFTLHYGDDMPLDHITRLLRLTNASGAKAYIVSAKRKLAKAVRRIDARGERL
ncbi:MAG: sigma-70 family RNA polymerase sigma factor [Acidobacteriota bacterium]|nr:sigma-70 family RNA polymerase sigma factor [Acidobacteriota bacterium]